jgi:hypothetical protein
MKFQIIRKSGILVVGNPRILTKELTLTFEGVPDGTEVIINTGEKVIFRKVTGGAVTINESLLEEGALLVTVVPGIACDELYVKRENGLTVVYRDDTERDNIIIALRKDVQNLTNTLEALSNRISSIYDGHELL